MPVITTALTALGSVAASTTAAATAAAASTGAAAASTGSLASAATTVGTLASVGGAAASGYAQYQSGQQQKAQEALRKQQMELESQRASREVIRKTQIARAQGINTAAQVGGSLVDSSAYGGITGQNTTNAGYELGSIAENTQIGRQLFDSNAAESGYNAQASLFGAGAQLGRTLIDNNIQIGRIGTTVANRSSLFNG